MAAPRALVLSLALLATALTATGTASAACPSASPCVLQLKEQAWGDDNPADHALSFDQPLTSGSTILVFTTDINIYGSPPGTGAPLPLAISDSGAGSYRHLVTLNNQYDWDVVRVYARSNVPAGNLSVRAVWTTNQWHGLVIAEIGGAPPSPIFSAVGTLNLTSPQGTNAVSSGTLDLGQSPALLLGFAFNSSAGTNDQGAPNPGTGFSTVGTAWNWNGREGTPHRNVALLEAAQLNQPGTVAATFTPGPSLFPNTFMAVAIALQGTPGTPAAVPAPASPAWAALLTALGLLGIATARSASGPRPRRESR
jgi:hypothetical protein